MHFNIDRPHINVQLLVKEAPSESEYIEFAAHVPENVEFVVKDRGRLRNGVVTIAKGLKLGGRLPTLLFEGAEIYDPKIEDSFGLHLSIDAEQFGRVVAHVMRGQRFAVDFWMPVDQDSLRYVGPDTDYVEWDVKSGRHVEIRSLNFHVAQDIVAAKTDSSEQLPEKVEQLPPNGLRDIQVLLSEANAMQARSLQIAKVVAFVLALLVAVTLFR